MINMRPTASRRVLRAFTVAVGISLVSLASPAYAAPPDTWETADNGSLLEQLLYLVGIPLAIIAVITLLTYLPSLTRRNSDDSTPAFEDRSEWVGGPRQGVEGAPDASATDESSRKGGASASW